MDIENLRVRRAVETLKAMVGHAYYALVECRRTREEGHEILVADVDVEVCQRPVYDIRNTERIAILFPAADNDDEPEVIALREDFPTEVPHRKLTLVERPVSVCLYEEPYAELKLHWTPHLFLERIREWLALTARNETHQPDQPLEPILGGAPIRLIVPWNLLTGADQKEPLIIRSASYGKRFTLVAEWFSKTPMPTRADFSYVALAIGTQPQVHGVIHTQPSNLADLHHFLETAGVDLIGYLREKLKELKDDDKYKDLLNLRLILVTHIPVTRTKGAPPEGSDLWAFATTDTIKEIGVKTGTWDVHDNIVGALILPDETRDGSGVHIEMLSPTPTLHKEWAAKLNGLDKADESNFVLIGVGALGSQVFSNLVRMGYGPWTVIDEDCLLPHNLARHALLRRHLGFSKAEAAATEANGILDGEKIALPIVANVLELSTREEIAECYNKASIIVDASTSLAVERHLARDVASSARRISVFLNPTGTDSVLLSEDSGRRITVDCLEMQYYRALINVPELGRHLDRGETGGLRYARSCRDVSLKIPQDSVGLHSAICARGIRNAIVTPDPQIVIWRTDPTFSVESLSVPVFESVEHRIREWTICTDTWFLQRVQKLRKSKLPNETGGVLIGAFDLERRIIYIVDTIPSPPDSVEWPTTYIRGCEGLSEALREAQAKTLYNLEYIGEWHSHPFGCSVSFSEDDAKAFGWMQEMMHSQGLPAFMLIIGNAGECGWNLAEANI